jgi:hypothetical protein
MAEYIFTDVSPKPNITYLRDAIVSEWPLKAYEGSVFDEGTEDLTVTIEILDGAEQDRLEEIVLDSRGRDKDEFYISKSLKDFVNVNAIVKDESSGVSGKFLEMQVLVNRREIFGDTENPLSPTGYAGNLNGRALNLETIHSKPGWHQQQVLTSLYFRPKDLMIYYGWLNSFNSATNGWDNENVAKDLARYGLLVFGDGVQDPSHGDYSNTQIIIPRIKQLNPEVQIFGYVTTNQTLTNFQAKVDQWNTLGVHGIFMDESGYDYGRTRSEFNNRVDYVHARSSANLCFANAWNTDHVLGTVNDTSYPNTTYNASEDESNLTVNDWILLESLPINTTAYTASTPDGYETKGDWSNRCVKAQGLRANYGVNFAACGIVDDATAGGQAMFDFSFTAACMFAWEGHGISDTSYGSSSAKGKWWTRPDVFQMGSIYSLNVSVQVDVSDSDVYLRYTQYGKFELDFSDSNNQDSTITKR